MMRSVVIGLLGALGCLIAASGAGAETIEFGTTSRSDSTSIATYIAFENKYFEDAGLQVEWVPAGSAAKAVQQTVAGSLNISIAATDATVRAMAEGASLQIVAGTVNAAPFRVVGGPGVKTWADLKGKLVSVGGPTDQTLFFFRVMARKNGLADNDYDLIYAGTTPARFAQLMSGQVGAAVLTNPNDLMALATGAADLGSAPDYVPVWSQNNAFVNTNWARAHRTEVVSFLKALKRAVDVFYDPAQRDKVIAIMAKYTGSDLAISAKIYDFYIEKKIIAPNAGLTEPGIQAVIDSLNDKSELKSSMKAADLIDTSYLADAKK